MDKLKKFDLMAKIARELEDLKNSQQAVLEKIGKIEVDNIELGNSTLEKELPEIYQRTADNADAIRDVLDTFQQTTDDYAAKNNIDRLREQQTINSIK
ncbi:hypothetical protein BC792_1231 [Sphingobacterium allocomposti]|uniref:Uncharacterized protein n=1 Tax=Sphingobacterium allocomposti TaxID=415956 RepID=A0A5S5D4E0_9SPHI|nr:hypothetical protein [Sphingobacterium composti Yoo et al. 2007 non Ten et al. 2007]TYP90903.1 hypothetical protein BC792_1231 [Sphingobacterium composti Yoo et al. 2007 non Ten et al. 2007]